MEKRINQKKQFIFLRLIAITLVLAMNIGLIPVNAKSKATQKLPSIEVSSLTQLVQQLKTDSEEEIIFSTDEAISITIPSAPYSSKKHLVIRTANASVTNKAKFASVTIEAVFNYTEKVSGNKITVNSDEAWITVYNKKKVSKLTINAANVRISLNKTAKIKNLVIKNTTGLDILLNDETSDYLEISRKDYEQYEKLQMFSEAMEVCELAKESFYKETDPVKMAEYAARGVLAALDDPYSFYYNPEEYTEMWADDEGSYCGIGIEIISNPATKICTVTRVFKDSPAEKAGVKRGDIIYRIGKDYYVTSDNLDEAVQKYIRGIPGTNVDITFLRNGEEISYTILRKDITINQVESSMVSNDIGYIALHQFAGNCEAEFESALNTLVSQGAKGLIIDLRDNQGGWVDQARYIADLFMDEGELCYLKYRNGTESHFEYPTTEGKADVKLVILVNENSASSSEILSGALRDCADATLVGVKTFGKGIVQGVYSVGTNGAGCQITVAQYFTPNGYSVHNIGITPDHIVELPDGDNGMYDFLDTENDIQLIKAIEVMKEKLK